MRIVALVLLVAACGSSGNGGGNTGPGGPGDRGEETAAARARREHAESGDEDASGQGKAWGGWRYSGSRDECFFVVGGRCFSELEAACKAARCGAKQCRTEGGGPATVTCRK